MTDPKTLPKRCAALDAKRPVKPVCMMGDEERRKSGYVFAQEMAGANLLPPPSPAGDPIRPPFRFETIEHPIENTLEVRAYFDAAFPPPSGLAWLEGLRSPHGEIKVLPAPGFQRQLRGYFEIDRVIFHDPATVVYWADGTKTIVKCQPGDTFSEEAGLAVAFMKRALGDKGNFNDAFRKWVHK